MLSENSDNRVGYGDYEMDYITSELADELDFLNDFDEVLEVGQESVMDFLDECGGDMSLTL